VEGKEEGEEVRIEKSISSSCEVALQEEGLSEAHVERKASLYLGTATPAESEGSCHCGNQGESHNVECNR